MRSWAWMTSSSENRVAMPAGQRERRDRARPREHVPLDVGVEALDAVVDDPLVAQVGRRLKGKRGGGHEQAESKQPFA
jgi:hypothetical protein